MLLIDGVPCGPITVERSYPVDPAQPRGEQYVKIPPGRYVCKRSVFYRGGYDTYEITGVVGHSRLLFHRGNAEEDSDGCILVGRRFGFVGMRPAVLESREGFAEFMRLTWGRSSFGLRVRAA